MGNQVSKRHQESSDGLEGCQGSVSNELKQNSRSLRQSLKRSKCHNKQRDCSSSPSRRRYSSSTSPPPPPPPLPQAPATKYSGPHISLLHDISNESIRESCEKIDKYNTTGRSSTSVMTSTAAEIAGAGTATTGSGNIQNVSYSLLRERKVMMNPTQLTLLSQDSGRPGDWEKDFKGTTSTKGENNLDEGNDYKSKGDEVKPKSSILIGDTGSSLPGITSVTTDMSSNTMTLGVDSGGSGNGIQESELDDFIVRLLEAGYSGKITKSICLRNSEILSICSAVRKVFLSQPALLELSPPVKIVGDVHGQFLDLIRLFEMSGFPPESNFLFLGDYVDRGKQSLETILLLFCYKLKYSQNFFLLRGNHECANVTRVYGFYDECKRRCNVKVWKAFIDVFNTLPIASVVAHKIFCVHGGLSPRLSNLSDIRRIVRPTDVPDHGLLNDLLWSDPADIENDWENNERGVSYCFGKRVITNFLARHDLDLVCRAHMVVEDGYEFFSDRVLVTIFSAPNYCGEFDNWGAVMSVSSELLCSFELLKPLSSSALKNHFRKRRAKKSSFCDSNVSASLKV